MLRVREVEFYSACPKTESGRSETPLHRHGAKLHVTCVDGQIILYTCQLARDVITFVITKNSTMTIETKVRKIGNSLGIVLPKEALQALNVEEGETLYLTESTENSVRMTAEQAGFQDLMEIAEAGMKKYRNALRELAK